MTDLSTLLLGIGMGLRHATDADHVVVVSSLVSRETGLFKTTKIAVLWGIGHTIAFLGIGLTIVLAGVRLPGVFERLADGLVAAMLLGFGGWHLWRFRRKDARLLAEGDLRTIARPLALGFLHGLAGSAGIALLAVMNIKSRAVAVSYLGSVALGTVIGMVGLTLIIARPIEWTMKRKGRVRNWVGVTAAVVSLALGTMVLIRALRG
jgi:nickel/cobalt transporter (NicO) family protein